MSIPVLELKGSAYERGMSHGARLKAQIEDNVETYKARFMAGSMSEAATLDAASRWADFIADDAPDYHEEMRGVAAGSGMRLTEIALLNARYELTYSVMKSEALSRKPNSELEEVDGCTSFGLEPDVTATGHTVIGQNWDWLKRLHGRMAVSRVHKEGSPSFVGLHEAGVVGCKMGVNENGMGLVVNGLITPEDGKNKFTRPLHVRCLNFLSAARFDKAIGEFISTPRTCSSNILIGHGEGEILNFEMVPDRHAVLYPHEGIITHANHLVSDLPERSLYEQIGTHTLYRGTRLRRLLRARSGQLGLGAITECLSDRFGFPASICRHEDTELPEAKRTITVASIVIDLTARILYVSDGPPCSNPLIAYPLEAGTRTV